MAFQGVLTREQVAGDPLVQLRGWEREHDFAVCIDTDGAVLDNMWAKQVVVFHPHFMDFNSLRGVEMHYRIHAEFHNLWSTTRGCDRYVAVRHILTSLLADPQARDVLPEAHVRGLLASVSGYVDWVDRSADKAYGIPSLTEYHRGRGLEYGVTRLLGWSEAVDRTFPFVTRGMPPFDGAEAALEYLADRADVLVVSATNYDDLAAWWTGAALSRYVRAIAGKEMGRKAEHIRVLKEAGGYADDEVMMIGDGGGDLKAARANNAVFYPVIAGREAEAWRGARDAFDAFLAGAYRGETEDALVADFEGALLANGPWDDPGYDAREEYRKLQQKRVDTYALLHPGGQFLLLEGRGRGEAV